MTDNRKNDEAKRNDSSFLKPDPETMHTTDPQENMEGPVSSTMHKTGDAFETDETKKEAEEKRDRNM